MLRLAALGVVGLVFVASWSAQAQTGDIEALFARGVTWTAFLGAARAQRAGWLKADAAARAPGDLVARARRIEGLRLLVVAEDWCPDSLQALPFVAKLAAAAPTPLRIVDRTAGAALMDRHRTPDGRIATPTVVVLKGGLEIGAWIERPAVVQQWFLTMAGSADSARQFANRQAWFDADGGRSTLDEILRVAERAREQ